MYAIIVDGGRQYRVEQGQELQIDFRAASQSGDQLKFDRVLAVAGDDGVQLGSPTLEGASVTAEVLGIKKGEKLVVQKLRRRKNSRRKTGHRQLYTSVRISEILTDGRQPSAPASAPQSESPASQPEDAGTDQPESEDDA